VRKPKPNFIDLARMEEVPQMASLSLDELRLRLVPEAQKAPQVEARGSLLRWRLRDRQQQEEIQPTIVSQPSEEVSLPIQPSAMIGEIFQPLKPLQEKLGQLVTALEPIDRVRPLAEALGPIRAFKDKLASAVEPIRNLEQETEQLAGVFEPMRIFRDELVSIKGAFGLKLLELTRTLEPLSKLCEHLAGRWPTR
jgi:hypothetical protein